MAANELEIQPPVAAEDENIEESSGRATPETKSGVKIDPKAFMQSAKFKKGDIVHTKLEVNNRLVKLTGEVYKLRYIEKGDFIEYQLRHPLDKSPLNGGQWFREKLLRMN